MIIAFGSDIHLDHGELFPFPKNRGADVLILAGDIYTFAREARYCDGRAVKFFKTCLDEFKNVIYVKGNHEDYHMPFCADDMWIEDFLSEPRFHFLQNRTVTIDGIVFAGCTLWTDQFKGSKACLERAQGWSDFRCIRGFTPEDAMAEHAKSRKFLEETDSDVVVTHFAPSGGSVNEKWAGHPDNGQFYSSMDRLILEKQPQYWIHGHMHDPCDYKIGSTRILCNPRGYVSERNPRYIYDFKYYEVTK